MSESDATSRFEADDTLIAEQVRALLGNHPDRDTLLNAATVLKYQTERKKALAETAHLRQSQRTEAIRFFVPVIAPLVSALAVVAALVFQTVQFRETSEIQRQTVELQANEAEDAQWREMIKTFTSVDPNSIGGIASVTLLPSFLQHGSHKEEARNVCTSLLG